MTNRLYQEFNIANVEQLVNPSKNQLTSSKTVMLVHNPIQHILVLICGGFGNRLGGFDNSYVAQAVAVKTYGQMVMSRTGIFVGTVGWMQTLPVGNTIIDIEKNGTSIFSTKPQFTQTLALTGGVLSTTTFATRDRITFKVTAIGSTAQPGTGMRVILKCKV